MDGCEATLGFALIGGVIVTLLLAIYFGIGGLVVRVSEPRDRRGLLLAWAAGVPVGAAAFWAGLVFLVPGGAAVFAGAILAALAGYGAACRVPEHGSWKSPLLGVLGGLAPLLAGIVLFVVLLTMTDGCMFS